MKPRLIIKSMQTTFDMLQEDLEESKKNDDQDTFAIYLKALDQIKEIQTIVKSTIKD